jgi:putative ABC transport system permease protein
MLDAIKSALASIWGNKARSLLTVLGVVIGVTSVTILISLGQGLKKDVSGAIEGFGTNVIAVVAGKIDTTKGQAAPNPADFVAGDILTLSDVDVIKALPHVGSVSPISLVSGNLQYAGVSATPVMFGAFPNLLDTVQLVSIDKGSMFKSEDGAEIILSAAAKEQLFGTTDPIGKKVTIAKQELTVVGYTKKAAVTNAISNQFNDISIIPFNEAKILNKNTVKIARILVHADAAEQVKPVKEAMQKAIKVNHDGQDDFTVLTQDDILGLFSTFLNLATAMVSAIAAISLVVGGIGIMNIMLVTVTERTREIGLRKAVGATSRAIMFQFLMEAIVITLLGGLIGLGIAYSIGLTIAAKTQLHPLFTAPTVLSALGISVFIGVVFGIWPAMRAAKKDPIEALRYE